MFLLQQTKAVGTTLILSVDRSSACNACATGCVEHTASGTRRPCTTTCGAEAMHRMLLSTAASVLERATFSTWHCLKRSRGYHCQCYCNTKHLQSPLGRESTRLACFKSPRFHSMVPQSQHEPTPPHWVHALSNRGCPGVTSVIRTEPRRPVVARSCDRTSTVEGSNSHINSNSKAKQRMPLSLQT